MTVLTNTAREGNAGFSFIKEIYIFNWVKLTRLLSSSLLIQVIEITVKLWLLLYFGILQKTHPEKGVVLAQMKGKGAKEPIHWGPY